MNNEGICLRRMPRAVRGELHEICNLKSLPSHKAMLYGRLIVFRSGPVPSTPRVALYVTRSLTLAR